jgi:hypothetical protein
MIHGYRTDAEKVRELIHLLRGHAQTELIKSESTAQVEILERHAGRSELHDLSAPAEVAFYRRTEKLRPKNGSTSRRFGGSTLGGSTSIAALSFGVGSGGKGDGAAPYAATPVAGPRQAWFTRPQNQAARAASEKPQTRVRAQPASLVGEEFRVWPSEVC